MSKRVLFVCIENANRSQMAEAFAHMHGGDAFEAFALRSNATTSYPTYTPPVKDGSKARKLRWSVTVLLLLIAHHSTCGPPPVLAPVTIEFAPLVPSGRTATFTPPKKLAEYAKN